MTDIKKALTKVVTTEVKTKQGKKSKVKKVSDLKQLPTISIAPFSS